MKIASIVMTLVMTGMFAHAEGEAAAVAAPTGGEQKVEQKVEKVAKKEKKHKKHMKKAEKAEKVEKVENETK